jgi:RND family efflux transporter MFP subunit
MQTKNEDSSARKLIVRGVILVVVMIIGIVFLYARKSRSVAAEATTRIDEMKEGPVVKVVKATEGSGAKDLVYLGEAVPYQSVVLYAKISGYVDKMLVDKGDKVKEGQLLATIISPEVDQLYASTLADLDNKKAILKRDEELLKKEYISQEEEEQAQTEVKVGEANVKSLHEQQQYKSITAPFNGTVTARFADPGTLLQNASNAQTSAMPVVTVGELNRLRIYVYVEQKNADFIKPGCPVTITLADNPQFKLDATVTRTTGQLDEQTRMMTTEIDVDNSQNEITAGSYVQVHIHVPATDKLQIPSEALVVRGTKYFVATVDADSCIRFKPVEIAGNNGQSLVVSSGLNEGDRVALNVGESVNEGQKVRFAN